VVAANLNDTTGTAIPDAVNYIFAKAQLLNEPCVINISLGDYYGSHDGLDLQAQIMNSMVTAQTGRVIVAAAGNAGNVPFHLGYTVTSDTAFTWFDYYSGRISLQLWSDTADFRFVKFAIGADDVSAGYSFRGRTNFTDIFARLNTFTFDTLKNGTNRLGIIRYYGQLLGSRYAMNIDIYPDSTADKWRLITTGSGKFDTWNFDVSTATLSDSTIFPDLAHYKLPDVNQSIVNSFQCSPEVITVGNYVNRNQYIDYDTVLYTINVTPKTLSFNSSKGPTRDGRIKPDITASGDYTMAPVVLSLVPLYLSVGGSYKLAMGGYHVRDGGTSTASPVVGGIAGLYLQRYPNSTNQDVRNAIINCPLVDSFTGSNLPNNDWGYGKVDGFTALTGCLTSTDHSPVINDANLFNYPNPFANETTIAYSLPEGMTSGEIRIIDVLGKVVRVMQVSGREGKVILKAENFSAGIYYCSLTSDGMLLKSCRLVIVDR
jgi:subtilisin family serine protease